MRKQEQTDVTKVAVQYLDVAMNDLKRGELVIARSDASDEEERGVAPVDNLVTWFTSKHKIELQVRGLSIGPELTMRHEQNAESSRSQLLTGQSLLTGLHLPLLMANRALDPCKVCGRTFVLEDIGHARPTRKHKLGNILDDLVFRLRRQRLIPFCKPNLAWEGQARPSARQKQSLRSASRSAAVERNGLREDNQKRTLARDEQQVVDAHGRKRA